MLICMSGVVAMAAMPLLASLWRGSEVEEQTAKDDQAADGPGCVRLDLLCRRLCRPAGHSTL